MINSISNLQLNKLQGIVRPYAPAPVKTASVKAEKAAVKNNGGISVAECAGLLNTAKAKNIPSQKKYLTLFIVVN